MGQKNCREMNWVELTQPIGAAIDHQSRARTHAGSKVNYGGGGPVNEQQFRRLCPGR
jgi:hypothetical protein